MLGPYIKSRGTRGTKMSANADLITVETYVQQGNSAKHPPPPPRNFEKKFLKILFC